jgi:hypothetical protein
MAPPAPPYYSQWETPQLVRAILRGQILAREDPAWASSGAVTPEEYEWWGRRVCGMACLRSVLAARGITPPPTVTLAKSVLAAGGYRYRADGGLDGLIYAPFVRWLATEWSIDAEVAAPLTVSSVSTAVDAGAMVMASVSPEIRRPGASPSRLGGHLVLVHDRTATELTFSNPSGDTADNQAGARVTYGQFRAVFAGRGVIIHP